MLDVYDWIVGNNYPRQEHLESLRAVDATANLGAESTVGAVHDGPLDSHPDMGVPAVRNTGPTFQATNPSAPRVSRASLVETVGAKPPSTALVRSRDPPSYLKDCPKTSAIEMEADWQRETRLIAARPNPLIRQPSLLLSGWTETHPESPRIQQGSVCITSHVRSHEEF